MTAPVVSGDCESTLRLSLFSFGLCDSERSIRSKSAPVEPDESVIKLKTSMSSLSASKLVSILLALSKVLESAHEDSHLFPFLVTNPVCWATHQCDVASVLYSILGPALYSYYLRTRGPVRRRIVS